MKYPPGKMFKKVNGNKYRILDFDRGYYRTTRVPSSAGIGVILFTEAEIDSILST